MFTICVRCLGVVCVCVWLLVCAKNAVKYLLCLRPCYYGLISVLKLLNTHYADVYILKWVDSVPADL